MADLNVVCLLLTLTRIQRKKDANKSDAISHLVINPPI